MQWLQVQGGGLSIKNIFRSPLLSAHIAFWVCLVLAFVAGSLMLIPNSGKAVTGLGLVGESSLAVNTPATSIGIAVTPTAAGAMAAVAHTVSVTTDMPTGYNLALATVRPLTLTTTTGTRIFPTVLTNNTWGYALQGVSVSSSDNTVTNGFDASYAVPTPSVDSLWANPSIGEIVKNTTAADKDDVTNIYYGIKADMNLAAGEYLNSVRYTVMPNADSLPDADIISVTPGSGTTVGGTAVEIVGTGFTVNDESITKAVTIGGVACTNVSISSNTPATGQDTIYCNTSAHAEGAVDAAVTTWAGTATKAGEYVYIRPATVSLVSPGLASTIGGTEGGAAFTIVGTSFLDVESVTIGGVACDDFTVVSSSHIFCKAQGGVNAAGENEVVVTKKNAIESNNDVAVYYSDEDYPTFGNNDAFSQCDTTAKLFRDERDSQLYYVKRMADGKCWMVDNLKYANYGELSQESGMYLTVDGADTYGTANSDAAKYVDPGAHNYCVYGINVPTTTNTQCGLLYNWYTATRGSGSYTLKTTGEQASDSICPANFRLPSSMSGTDGPTTSGRSYVAADFAVLNASMNAGALATGDAGNYPAGWQPSGEWGGFLTGRWLTNFTEQNSYGNYWSSTVNGVGANGLRFSASEVSAGAGWTQLTRGGSAVRCVMDAPTPTIVSIYPTKGATTGNTTVSVFGTNFVSGAMSVKIGSDVCSDVNVISDTKLTCVVPAGAIGTYDVTVANATSYATSNNSNSIYTYHAATPATMQTFTSANCSSMSMGSITALRDVRDGKIYRVRKMPDNKCWMIDNLAYTGGGTNTYGDVVPNGSSGAGVLIESNGTENSPATNWLGSIMGVATTSRFYTNNSTEYLDTGTRCSTSEATGTGASQSVCGEQILYNWCAAVGLDSSTTPTCAGFSPVNTGTGYALTGVVGKTGSNVGGESKGDGGSTICPTSWRMPIAQIGTGSAGSFPGDTMRNEWGILLASMIAGSYVSTPSTESPYYYWSPNTTSGSGNETWRSSFGTVSSGYLYSRSSTANDGLRNQSSAALWHSPSQFNGGGAGNFVSNSSLDASGPNHTGDGVAVRCVMQ